MTEYLYRRIFTMIILRENFFASWNFLMKLSSIMMETILNLQSMVLYSTVLDFNSPQPHQPPPPPTPHHFRLLLENPTPMLIITPHVYFYELYISERKMIKMKLLTQK